MEYVRLNPKSVSQLASSISSEMHGEMMSAISDGRLYASLQFKVGKVFIEVEVPAWESPGVDSVAVIHENYEHRSPRLEEAIRAKLPSWADAERDAQETREQWEAQERHQWLNLRS